jgi:hypothetical protein
VENVQSRAGDATFAQHSNERRLVNGLATPGTDIVRIGLHRGEESGVKQSGIFRRRGQNIDQVVGLACGLAQAVDRQDLVEATCHARRAACPNDMHAERLEHFADCGADDTGAGDRRGLAVERPP